MKRLRRCQVGVLAAVAVALLSACTARVQAPAAVPQSAPSPTPSALAADKAQSLTDLFNARGLTCFRGADFSRRSLTDKEIQGLATAAASRGAEGGWLHLDKDPFAPGQVYLGTLDGAAKAYGGEVVGAASDPAVAFERGEGLMALSFAPIDIGNGSAAWLVASSLESVDCAATE